MRVCCEPESSALKSAEVLVDEVVGPAMAASGLDPQAIQLLRVAGRDAAFALVRQPQLIPLVILRGSGDSTRSLAREAALHGVRTLAHADGGAVIYLDQSADHALAMALIEQSLDRLGVCNRLNLLLVHAAVLGRHCSAGARRWPGGWASRFRCRRTSMSSGMNGRWMPARRRPSRLPRPPAPRMRRQIANRETSGLAASIVAADADAAHRFLDTYAGTGAFWNATPRLLDGFKLLSVPETGINIDVVPGPRGPVTFRDLYLRQYAVVPSRPAALALRRVDDQRLPVHRVDAPDHPARRGLGWHLTVQEPSVQQERGAQLRLSEHE